MRKRIIKSGIVLDKVDENFPIILNILHFKTKYNLYTEEMYERRKVSNYKRENSGHSLISDEIVSVNSLEEEAEALLDSEVPKKNYKQITQIGKGGFGRVLLYKSEMDNESVAVKRTPHVTDKNKRKNFQEIRFLKYCNHPNILRFIRCSLYSDEMWIVTEYLNGGALSQIVGIHKFTEPEILYICKNIANAIAYLHEIQLAHRDIKSGNIMIEIEGTVKLIDFGLCSDISQGEVVHMVGSPHWMPPEMIKRVPHGLGVDIWSFGICIMEMANGAPPYRKSAIRAMYEAATIGYPEAFARKSKWSGHFQDFLSKCLIVNPEERWTIKQLIEHPFLEPDVEKESISDLFKTLLLTNKLKFNGV
jgi:serine/threonine protein kinase